MSIKGCANSDSTKMNEELWNRVDDFLSEVLGTSDPVLETALRASAKAGLPAIQVSANQGRLLQLLAQTQGARGQQRDGARLSRFSVLI